MVTIGDPERQWFRAQEASQETREALDSSLKERDLTGSQGIVAELARGAADLVDSARNRQDPRLWLAASQRLLALVDRLDGPGDRNAGVQPGRGDGGVSDEADELDAALGSGPEVGD